MTAGEQIRRRQSHEAQPRAVRAAANRSVSRLESGATDRLARVLDDLGMPVQHLLEVAVALFHAERDRGPRPFLDRLARQLLEVGFLFL